MRFLKFPGFDLQQFGPAAIPIASAAIALFSTVSSVKQQSAQNAAAKAAQQNQSDLLAQESSLAQQEAQGPSFQSLLDAQKGGVNTFQSTAGGVPNIGALVQSLFGQNISNALSSSLQQRNANINGAAGILNGNANAYGNAASGAAQAAGNGGNPLLAGATTVTGLINGLPKSGSNNTGTATGPGSGSGDYVNPGINPFGMSPDRSGGSTGGTSSYVPPGGDPSLSYT